MKVLSIVPFPILPLTHGGRVRAYRLAVGLSRAGADVDLACPWHPGLPRDPFEHDGITIRPFVHAANVLPKLVADRVVPSPLHLSIQPRTLGPRRLLRRTRLYDVAEFHLCAYARWMAHVAPRALVAYAAHNVEWDYVTAARAPRLGGAYAQMIAALERRAIQASDVIVTCTEADAVRLRDLYGKLGNVAVVPNGFDEEGLDGALPPVREEVRADLGIRPEELAILFVGGRAFHNRRAVYLLEHEVLPRLTRPARLVVVGQCARPRRQAGLISLGYVDSLVPLLAAADVAVNPVEAGSGSNVKLAEYLAARLPIVTTPVGLRGYEAFADVVTVAPFSDFAPAVENARRRDGPHPRIRELGWTALGRRLFETYADILGNPRRAAHAAAR